MDIGCRNDGITAKSPFGEDASEGGMVWFSSNN